MQEADEVRVNKMKGMVKKQYYESGKVLETKLNRGNIFKTIIT